MIRLTALIVGGTVAGLSASQLAWAGGPAFIETKTVYALPNRTLSPAATSNLGTFNIVINPGPGLSANAPALAAFNRAAAVWQSRFSDPITITIDADLDALDAGIIGSTNSVSLAGGYTTVRNAMVNDGAAAAGGAILSSLPTAAQFSAVIPNGRSLDGNVLLSKANAKALGFTGLDAGFGATDAQITFSTNFSFDYDRSDGITSTAMDFEAVAAHEIGHALGFTSAVDDLDQTTAAELPSFAFTTLDMFRFGLNSNNPSTAAEFTSLPRNFVPGAAAVTDDVANEYQMSTGVSLGDGGQASHWKADDITGNYIGIMDPTLALGQLESATEADYRAFDLIGYDVVPEPAMLGTLGLAAMIIGRRRRLP